MTNKYKIGQKIWVIYDGVVEQIEIKSVLKDTYLCEDEESRLTGVETCWDEDVIDLFAKRYEESKENVHEGVSYTSFWSEWEEA